MVKGLKNVLLVGLTLPILPLCGACGEAVTQAQIDQLKAQLLELSKNYARLQVRVENNSQRLEVLYERPPSKSAPVIETQSAGPRPPDHLQVVTISPEKEEHPVAIIDEVQLDFTPDTVMRQADGLLESKDFDGAEVKYLKFLSYFPDNPQAGKARFKLGEIAFDRSDFRAAMQFFADVVAKSPAGSLVPDALYKQGLALEKMAQKDEAVAILKKLINSYPDTIAAKKARVRLLQMEQAE